MISVIICNIDPTKWTTIKAMYHGLLRDTPHEIIGIHDAPSMGAGYQRGMQQSKGDILIFSHDDVEFLAADFAQRLGGHLRRYDLIGVAGTSRLLGAAWNGAGPPYSFGQVANVDPSGRGYIVKIFGAHAPVAEGVHAMDGLFLACHRAVAQRVNWDAVTFSGWHCYDIDFTFRAHLAGYKLAVCNDLLTIHASAGIFDDRWEGYARKFADKFRGQLALGPAHRFRAAVVWVPTKRAIIEVMTPAFWGQSQPPDDNGLILSAWW